MHSPWMAMRSLTRDGEVAKRSSRPGTIPRIARFAAPYRRQIDRLPGRSWSSTPLVGVALPAAVQGDHRRRHRRPTRRRQGDSSWSSRSRARRARAVRRRCSTLCQRWFSARIGEGLIYDLRTAGLRPRAADADRVLHPHPDRRAGQPAQQRRHRRPAGVHLDAVVGRRRNVIGARPRAGRDAVPVLADHPGRAGAAAAVPPPGPAGSGAGCRRSPARPCSSTPRCARTMTERFNVVRRAAGQAVRPACDEESATFADKAGRVRDIGVTAGDVRPGLLHRADPGRRRWPRRWSTASAASLAIDGDDHASARSSR